MQVSRRWMWVLRLVELPNLVVVESLVGEDVAKVKLGTLCTSLGIVHLLLR